MITDDQTLEEFLEMFRTNYVLDTGRGYGLVLDQEAKPFFKEEIEKFIRSAAYATARGDVMRIMQKAIASPDPVKFMNEEMERLKKLPVILP